MGKTHVNIQGESFLINGKLTYSEIESSNPNAHGLLMNARFIQGVFDDRAAPERFARWGHDTWDPTANTERLIAALGCWAGSMLLWMKTREYCSERIVFGKPLAAKTQIQAQAGDVLTIETPGGGAYGSD